VAYLEKQREFSKKYVVAKGNMQGEDSSSFLISSEIIPKPSVILLKTWVNFKHIFARVS